MVTIKIDERPYVGTFRDADLILQHENKPIFYDFLLALKNRGGSITDLISIERLGGKDRGYIDKKDWDAGQLLRDKMPMIYIVPSPAHKLEILRTCQHIGKDFPLLTETEFHWFMIGMHNAYNDADFDFSFENFVKSLFLPHPNGGKNWENWGMTNNPHERFAEMIQGSFGIHSSGNYICTDPDYTFTWAYLKRRSETTQTPSQTPFIVYNWGDRLQNNYWQFAS